MSYSYRLLVNNAWHEIVVDYEDTPLLYVLRNDLGLKGTRFGCGSGQCGSCTVLIDGHALRSCEQPVWSMEGKAITTIEGLGSGGHLHPLQQAMIDFQAGQCCYCVPGIMMSAAELIGSDAPPAREAITAALERNLCRCGAHTRILKAIEAAWRKVREGARG
jgi:nicotinate dehydrogenase subunit A